VQIVGYIKTQLWVSPFGEAFQSDLAFKATKGANVHFFNHCSNFCKLYQRVCGTLFKLLRATE